MDGMVSQKTPRLALQKIFDCLLLLVIFALPLFMGGRGPVGQFVFVALVALMALVWCADQLFERECRIYLSGAEWILVGGFLLLMLQLFPFPENVLRVLSPEMPELLPMWFSSSDPNHIQIGNWRTISLAPEQTRTSLAVYIAYCVLFLLTVQRIRSRDQIEWLVKSLAVATVFLAAIGLAQFLWGNGNFLWFYDHPFRDTSGVVKGPYQNQNHFAHMMALGIGPLIWVSTWLWKSTSRGRGGRRQSSFRGALPSLSLCVAGIVCVGLATALTFSRGGVIAFTVGTLLTVAAYCYLKILSRRELLLVAGLLATIGAALFIHGNERFVGRLSTLTSSSSLAQLSHAREHLWDAMFEAVGDFWFLGVGAGAHVDVYPVYMKEVYSVKFTHGESGYLSVLMEMGVVGLALLIAAIVTVCMWCKTISRQGQTSSLVVLAVPLLAGLVASLVHALADFPWYLSSCMAWTVILLALVVSICQQVYGTKKIKSDRARRYLPRWFANRQITLSSETRIVCVVLLLSLSLFSVTTLAAPAFAVSDWDEYQRVVRNAEDDDSLLLDKQATLLEATLRRYPKHRKAKLILSVKQFQDSAEKSDRALAADAVKCAMECVAGSPLRGEAYAVIGAVRAQLNLDSPQFVDAFLRQALKVRGFDPVTRMVCGKLLLSRGELDDGLEHWRYAYQNDPKIKKQLSEMLTKVFPAAFLVERLQPDIQGLRLLYHDYRRQHSNENQEFMAKELVAKLRTESTQNGPVESGAHAMELYRLHLDLGEMRDALIAVSNAVKWCPSEYSYRREYAGQLYRCGEYQHCDDQVQWCLARVRDDRVINSLALRCSRELAAVKNTGGIKY